ncbi:MAG: winged helix-turn-helix domain-containing protein [Anaerolineae bacterium]|nr:winged helix-turn-helix domain-containing protein [Anaerolineae bacterium]
MHILVVHPDPRFYRELLSLLSQYKASGAFARTLMAACDQIEAHRPQMIILFSPCLQEEGADELLALLKADRRELVLFLTSAAVECIREGPERDRLAAILASVSEGPPGRRLRYRQVGNLRIDLARQRVMLEDQWVHLPRIQFHILRYLMEHSGELVSYTELLKAVWGYEGDANEARELLKVHLRQIRRKLGAEFLPYLQIVRGEGYVLVDPQEED